MDAKSIRAHILSEVYDAVEGAIAMLETNHDEIIGDEKKEPKHKVEINDIYNMIKDYVDWYIETRTEEEEDEKSDE